MTEDLSQLLRRHRADPDPVDVDALVDRGLRRRRRRHTSQVGGALVVVVLVALAAVSSLRSTPVPPIVDDPSPTEPTEPTEATETSPAPGAGALPVVGAAELGVDVLRPVDGTAEEDGHVRVDRADGSSTSLAVDTALASQVAMVPDGRGGFVWQPAGGAGGSPPILWVAADGTVTEVVPSTTDTAETYTLVGAGEGEALVERRQATGDAAAVELVAYAHGGGSRPVMPVPADAVVSSAAAIEEAVLLQRFEEVGQVVVAWPDREPEVAYEGDALQDRAVVDVSLPDSWTAAVLVGGGEPRLVLVNTRQASVVGEVDVPVATGSGNGSVTATEVSAAGGHVLVNRRDDAGWLPPVVYDVEADRWMVLDSPGRALLARATAEPAEDPECDDTSDRRNAPPRADVLDLYLACLGDSAVSPLPVYRHEVDEDPTGDVAADARTVLNALLDGAPADLADQGYSGLSRSTTNGTIGIRSVALAEDTLVVDFAFPERGVGNWSTSFGSMVWHRLLVANLLQFDGVQRLELRANGTCNYGRFFEGEGCGTYDRSDAPWPD